MTITEFLQARLDEDEQAAHKASPGPWHPELEGEEVVAVDGVTVADGFALSGEQLRATVSHIARHDPARVLRDVEAKRAIIAHNEKLHEYARANPREDAYLFAPGASDVVLKHLASVYSDHSDYQEDWKP